MYIECDCVVKAQKEEDFYFAELDRMRKEQGVPINQLVHYDTQCTVENQVKMFQSAGFKKVKKVWQEGNTVIIVNVR